MTKINDVHFYLPQKGIHIFCFRGSELVQTVDYKKEQGKVVKEQLTIDNSSIYEHGVHLINLNGYYDMLTVYAL